MTVDDKGTEPSQHHGRFISQGACACQGLPASADWYFGPPESAVSTALGAAGHCSLQDVSTNPVQLSLTRDNVCRHYHSSLGQPTTGLCGQTENRASNLGGCQLKVIRESAQHLQGTSRGPRLHGAGEVTEKKTPPLQRHAADREGAPGTGGSPSCHGGRARVALGRA